MTSNPLDVRSLDCATSRNCLQFVSTISFAELASMPHGTLIVHLPTSFYYAEVRPKMSNILLRKRALEFTIL